MYIKIEIDKVLSGEISVLMDFNLAKLLQNFGLDVKEGDDIGEKLIWEDRDGFRYLDMMIMDKEHKCRQHEPSEEEKEAILDYVTKGGFELVESIPETSEELPKK